MPVLDLPSLHIDDTAAPNLVPVGMAQLFGETDPDKLSAIAADWLVARDFAYTISIMCAPGHSTDEDAGIVTRLRDALNADEVHHACSQLSEIDGLAGSVQVALEPLLAVADRENLKKIVERLLREDWLAHIAVGYILRWIVSRWLDPNLRNDASLTRAVSVVEEWCTTHSIKGGGAQNITRNLWPKYRSVSHFWAAFYVIQDAGIEIHTPDGFSSFLSTAQWLLEMASNIVPRGRRPGEAILSRENAWQVPPSYVRRARREDTGEDLGIVADWITALDAHDIRSTRRPPIVEKRM